MIPTAEEVFNNFVDFKICSLKEYTPKILTNDTKLAMIEFAKLHVEAALKEASEKAHHYHISTWKCEGVQPEVNKDSILNAYPLENIK